MLYWSSGLKLPLLPGRHLHGLSWLVLEFLGLHSGLACNKHWLSTDQSQLNFPGTLHFQVCQVMNWKQWHLQRAMENKGFLENLSCFAKCAKHRNHVGNMLFFYRVLRTCSQSQPATVGWLMAWEWGRKTTLTCSLSDMVEASKKTKNPGIICLILWPVSLAAICAAFLSHV